jgi:uncharacterized protein (UPF0264 family)
MTPREARRSAASWRGLLVSVRSVAEAEEALAGGAAIIDVKEPARGPLGQADAGVAAAIGGVAADRVPWTVACGELVAGPTRAAALAVRCAADSGVAMRPPTGAKAGPAGLTAAAWRRHFALFAAALPPATPPIAVAYADWSAAGSPCPEAIIAGAADVAACAALLIDTFDKRGPSLLELVSPATIREWLTQARARGWTTAVAGRLSLDTLPHAAALGADVLAVRGAVCDDGRLGRVSRARVAAARLCYRTWVGAFAACPNPVIVPSEQES